MLKRSFDILFRLLSTRAYRLEEVWAAFGFNIFAYLHKKKYNNVGLKLTSNQNQ
jgi:hypothetical protein